MKLLILRGPHTILEPNGSNYDNSEINDEDYVLEEGKDFDINSNIIQSVKDRVSNLVLKIYYEQGSKVHNWLVQNQAGKRVEIING